MGQAEVHEGFDLRVPELGKPSMFFEIMDLFQLPLSGRHRLFEVPFVEVLQPVDRILEIAFHPDVLKLEAGIGRPDEDQEIRDLLAFLQIADPMVPPLDHLRGEGALLGFVDELRQPFRVAFVV